VNELGGIVPWAPTHEWPVALVSSAAVVSALGQSMVMAVVAAGLVSPPTVYVTLTATSPGWLLWYPGFEQTVTVAVFAFPQVDALAGGAPQESASAWLASCRDRDAVSRGDRCCRSFGCRSHDGCGAWRDLDLWRRHWGKRAFVTCIPTRLLGGRQKRGPRYIGGDNDLKVEG
jgi:hypothetical protein